MTITLLLFVRVVFSLLGTRTSLAMVAVSPGVPTRTTASSHRQPQQHLKGDHHQVDSELVQRQKLAVVEPSAATSGEKRKEEGGRKRRRDRLLPVKQWKAMRRSSLIWSCAVRIAVKWSRLRRLRGEKLVEARRTLASEFREVLLYLGPTFIKFGQLLSTRVDALPKEVISELVSLQNEVPGFSTDRVLEILAEEIGELPFERFDREPLAAASLAQVHRARLDGEEVVVKIQRDGLRELFEVDCANIRFLARVADALDPQEEGVSSDWKGIAETSEGVLYREIDFRVEKESAEKFRQNFEGCDWVKIPKTFPEYCTEKVLVLEYVKGRKINDPPPECDPVKLSERLTTSYLEQLCRHGFFHCDPHPGNVACDDHYPGGRIIYYDFGMMETIETPIKKGFVDLVYSLYKNEPNIAVDALEKMGVLRPSIDRFSIERIARNYVNTFAETVSSDEKWDNQLDPEEAKERRRARRAKLGSDLFAAQADRPFRFPPKFTFVFRAISTIDGIGKSLDKNYDLTKLSSPYLRELADLRDGSAVKTGILDIAERLGWRPKDVGQVVTQPRTVSKIQTSLQRLEQGELKLRVRTTECEAVVDRIETRQKLQTFALASYVLFYTATQPVAASAKLPVLIAKKIALLASFLTFYKTVSAYLELDKLERRKTRFFNLDKQDDSKML